MDKDTWQCWRQDTARIPLDTLAEIAKWAKKAKVGDSKEFRTNSTLIRASIGCIGLSYVDLETRKA